MPQIFPECGEEIDSLKRLWFSFFKSGRPVTQAWRCNMNIDQNVLQGLLDSNPRFRMLYEEHSLLEKRLSEFEGKPFLSPQDELEVVTVKKLKLVGKDEMEQIVASARG